MKKSIFVVLAVVLFTSVLSFGQATIVNIPSADVMDKGKAYVWVNQTYMPDSAMYTNTPGLLIGLGKGFEADINVESFSHNAPGYQVAVVPGFKYSRKLNKSLTVFGGDKVGFPTHNKSYTAINYAYLAGAYSLKNVRFTAGAFNSQNYTANGNRTGALLGLEVTAYSKDGRPVLMPMYDWSSGKGSNGASAFGLGYYPTKRLLILPSYQIGNYGVRGGNHQAILYIGYNLN
jgi:hypothetical protein